MMLVSGMTIPLGSEIFKQALKTWVCCVLENATQDDVIVQPRFTWVPSGENSRRQVFNPSVQLSYMLTHPSRFQSQWDEIENAAKLWPMLNESIGKHFEVS
jgi:hypothetical protein